MLLLNVNNFALFKTKQLKLLQITFGKGTYEKLKPIIMQGLWLCKYTLEISKFGCLYDSMVPHWTHSASEVWPSPPFQEDIFHVTAASQCICYFFNFCYTSWLVCGTCCIKNTYHDLCTEKNTKAFYFASVLTVLCLNVHLSWVAGVCFDVRS